MFWKKILGFSIPGFYLDLIVLAFYTFDFRLPFFPLQVYRYVFCIITEKNGAPLIWPIPFDFTTSVSFTIAVQSRKRAISGAVRTKRLSTSVNQEVNSRIKNVLYTIYQAEVEERTPGYIEVQIETARNENLTDKISKKFVLTQTENEKGTVHTFSWLYNKDPWCAKLDLIYKFYSYILTLNQSKHIITLI